MSDLQPYRQIAVEEKQSFNHYKKLRLLAKTRRALKAILGKNFIKAILHAVLEIIKSIFTGLIQSILACFLITIFPLFWIIRGIDIGFCKGKSKDLLKNLLIIHAEDFQKEYGFLFFMIKYLIIVSYVSTGIISIISFLVKSFW